MTYTYGNKSVSITTDNGTVSLILFFFKKKDLKRFIETTNGSLRGCANFQADLIRVFIKVKDGVIAVSPRKEL